LVEWNEIINVPSINPIIPSTRKKIFAPA